MRELKIHQEEQTKQTNSLKNEILALKEDNKQMHT